ncbi:hypothetical protein LUZ60_013705 [Juncus effusus]|nr:hypothetical protein LUZ60_013705 [Juncus effusus]
MGIPNTENQTEESEGSTMETRGGEEEKKIVLIGVKMDSRSREMLTWALVNLAGSGDQFVACHVITTPGASSSALNSELDSMLAVYEGFCHLKQIELKLKICKGLSVRRALVHEAKNLGASNLILGVAKNKHRISHSLAIAKHCAKKLHLTCSVISVNNGKIIFQSDKTKSKSEESDLYCVLPSRYNAKPKELQIPNGASTSTEEDLYCVLPPKNPVQALNADQTSTVLALNADQKSPVQALNADQKSTMYALNADQSSPVQALNADQYCSWPKKADPNNSSGLTNGSGSGSNNWTDDESASSISSPCNSEINKKINNNFGLRKRVLKHRRCLSSDWTMVKWALRISNGSRDPRPVNPLRVDGSESQRSDSFDSSLNLNLNLGENWSELDSLKERYEKVLRVFGFDELDSATSNFSQDNLIGKGGSSRVYKAKFQNDRDLAVKVLKPSDDSVKEFISEVEIANLLHHRNIIALLGFCFENNRLILVYEYLSNGSLEEILHGEGERKYVLNWKERYKIAIGIAEALEYLHTGGGSHESVIHGDVKSSNILLSRNFDPQLSDFGFAKRVSSPTSNLTCTDIAGTFGYLAPECFIYGRVNEKIDVYAYGVVLLELISGRKPIKTGSPKGHESLVAWAKPLLVSGKIEELVDPCLINGEDYNGEEMERIIMVASLCLRNYSQSRPDMSLVVRLLKGDGEAKKWHESQTSISEESLNGSDEELITPNGSNIKSYLNLALLDLDEDSVSVTSTDQTVESTLNASIEDYLDRWSRSSSFE